MTKDNNGRTRDAVNRVVGRVDRPVRVLFVSSIRFFSGSEIALLDLVRQNASLDPLILVPSGRLLKQAREEGIPARKSRTLSELRRAARPWWPIEFIARIFLSFIEITYLLIRRRPDIVHANNFAAALYTVLPARASRLPIVWHIHDIFPMESIEAAVIRNLAGWIDIMVVPSRAVERNLHSIGVPADTIVRIPYGIDTKKRFNPDQYSSGALRGPIGISPDALTVGICGQIAYKKGIHVFLDAIEIVAERNHADVRYVIIGSAPETESAYLSEIKERACSSPALRDSLIFTGWRSDIPQVLKDLDVVVVPSITPDPLPTTVLQAMAMGKTVIGSRVGGVPEMIEDAVTGFLFEPGSADGLAQRLRWVFSNTENLRTQGARARHRIERYFDQSSAREAVTDTYRGLIHKTHP